MAQRTLFLLYS